MQEIDIIMEVILAWFPLEIQSHSLSPAIFDSRLVVSVILSIHLSLKNSNGQTETRDPNYCL